MSDKGSLTVAEVAFWLAEARSCEERQKIELIQGNNYPFLINYYEGVDRIDAAHPHVSTQQQLMIINEYFPNTNTLISELMYQNPDILVDATRPDAEEDAPLMRSALRYLWEKSGALDENRIALFDMLFAGYCAVEVDVIPPVDRDTGKSTGDAPAKEEPKSIFDQFKKTIKNAMNEKEAEENLARLSPPIETAFATAQGTYIRRYSPLDVPLDWRASRVKDRRYNLKKVWMSKAEFDTKYSKFRDRVMAEEQIDFGKHGLSIHNNKVMLYEFQVRMRSGEYMTIVVSDHVKTREIDSFIRPYVTNGFNMKIGNLHKYGKLYPKSFAQINRKMQDEMNGYVRHLMEVAERNHPKYLIDKNKVLEDGKAALRSSRVNDLVEVDGNITGAVEPLQPTVTSIENKELLSIFQDQKNKLWSVSESRISGRAQAQFATDLAIQEQGFQQKNVDIQEGLRLVIQDQLDTGKDIIATFWDDAVFLKVTGSEKMDWYEPIMIPDPNDPSKQIVANPLTEILTADYEIKIDIASAVRPNRRDQLNNMFFFMTQLVQIRPILNAQQKDINIDEIKRVSKEFGWNPDKLFVDFNTAQQPSVPAGTGETLTPEEDAARQAEAEARVNAGAV